MKKVFCYLIGTGFGTGYSPLAPGTAGSLLALVLMMLWPASSPVWLGITFLFLIAGIWSGTCIEREKGEDPSLVVVDEMVGQWIALLFLPAYALKIYGAAFLLFRLFDIWKPYPIYQSQRFKGGWGIMMDDVLAGIYANILLQLVLRLGVWS
jgi:phosphatidylglycerophosphatase A